MKAIHPLPRTDWYFTKKYLTLFALVFTAVLGLLIIGDLFQKTDEFAAYADRSDNRTIIVIFMALQYYLTFAPAMLIRYLLPMVMILAGMVTVTSSAVHNEYTVLRSSGISIQRSMAPILLATLLITYSIHFTRDQYMPFLLRKGHAVATEIKPTGALPISLVLRDGDTIQTVSMGHFDIFENRYVAHNLRIETRKAKDFFSGSDDFSAYTAWEAYLQPRTDPDREEDDIRDLQWKPARNAMRYDYTFAYRNSDTWEEPVPTLVTPAMLERQVLGEAVMRARDLELLGREELDARLELHRRSSQPWAITALIWVGLSLVLGFMARGSEPSYIINVVIAILLCAAFYILRNSFLTLGESEALGPFLAAWMPVGVMAAIGVILGYRLEH